MNTTSNVWFITGASAGFGRAFAEYALNQGHNIVVTARRLERLVEIQAVAPERVEPVKMDVTRPEEVKAAVAQAISRFGRIDVLLNNAGYGIVGALEETPEAELRAQMETNFFGAVSVMQEVLPQMREQRSGAIVNMSSMGGQMSFSGFSAYSASKFALEGASEALAQEVAPFGIKVMIVEPGAFKTEFAGSALRHMPKIDAYDETVGGTREFAKSMDGTQAGDPYKAAAAIEQAINSEQTPLRLALGSDAIDAIRQHSQSLLDELANWESVGRATELEVHQTSS